MTASTEPCNNPWPFTSPWLWNSATKKGGCNGVTLSWTTSSYRVTRQAIEEIFRGLQQELGWVGHRHRTRVRLLAHLALGMVGYGLVELQRERLKLSFYQCRRKLMAGRLTLDLSPLEAA